MIKLKPIILPRVYENKLKKEILEIIYSCLFEPLIEELDYSKQYYNSNSAIRDGLLAGKIQYSNGIFKGQFNIKIAKEFKELGFKYNSRIEGYKIQINNLPVEIQQAIGQVKITNKTIATNILNKLKNINFDEIKQKDFSYIETIGNVDKQFNSSIATTLEIAIDLTNKQKQIIAKEYSNNMKLYVKKFLKDEVKILREETEQAVNAGYRAEYLKEIIKERFKVSDAKAEFLAKQESSLLVSKYTQLRFKDAGINKYQWSTSNDNRVRHDHKLLDGKIISYDDPPIVDLATGRKAHAGEDYGCRCVQIPVII